DPAGRHPAHGAPPPAPLRRPAARGARPRPLRAPGWPRADGGNERRGGGVSRPGRRGVPGRQRGGSSGTSAPRGARQARRARRQPGREAARGGDPHSSGRRRQSGRGARQDQPHDPRTLQASAGRSGDDRARAVVRRPPHRPAVPGGRRNGGAQPLLFRPPSPHDDGLGHARLRRAQSPNGALDDPSARPDRGLRRTPMPIMLITLAIFAVLTTIVLSAGWAVSARSPITQRVQQLVGEAPRRTQRGERAGLLGRLVAGIGTYGFGGDRSLSNRLSVAGFRGPKATATFLGVRTLISVGPALAMLVPAVSSGKPLGRALMLVVFAGLWGHLLANLWLRRRARARVEKITKALHDALDLMVV